MTDGERHAIEADGARLLLDFFHALDERRYEDMATAMLPDGIWSRQGRDLVGPQGVLGAMRARPAGLHTRHVITNLRVTPRSREAADFGLYLTAYMAEGEPGAAPPFTIRAPAMLLVVPGRLALADARWRIAAMSMQRDLLFDISA